MPLFILRLPREEAELPMMQVSSSAAHRVSVVVLSWNSMEVELEVGTPAIGASTEWASESELGGCFILSMPVRTHTCPGFGALGAPGWN